LSQFEVLAPDRRYHAADRQFWGLTFVDSDAFYVTGYFGEDPEILFGSIQRKTIKPTGYIGSCPAVSPDGRLLAFKQLRDDGSFEIAVAEVETGTVTVLNEDRSIDDQVEWLDNDTILYALHPDGEVSTGALSACR